MGSDAKKAFGAVGRDDLLYFDPNDLLIVSDKDHPLYDERAFIEPQEWMIRSIMKNGVIEPIVVRKNGEDPKTKQAIVEVVDGRQRVKAAIVANLRLAEAGADQLVRVPGIRKRGDDGDLQGLMITLNEIRLPDPPMVKAKKLARFMNLGRSIEDAEVAFGATAATLRGYLSLLDCHPDVQKAVEKGRLGVTHARSLAAMPQAEQKVKLAELLEKPQGVGGSAASNGSKVNGASDAAPSDADVADDRSLSDRIEEALGGRGKVRNRTMRTLKEIKSFRKRLDKSRAVDAAFAQAMLDWMLGKDGALGKFRAIKSCAEGAEEED